MTEALPVLCAESAEQAGEPLAGTAAHARWWVLLEERGAWAREALASEGLDPFRPSLARWLEVPSSRLQLVRHPRDAGPRRLFVADAWTGRVGAWTLDDPAAFFAGDPPFDALAGEGDLPSGGERVEAPLFFVCTHGRRDRCCALRGMALYRALAATEGPGEVWQTTHLGGHRFAATLVTFPHGYCLGRVAPEEAPLVRAAGGLHDASRIRGRVGYDEANQAADAVLRAQLGLLAPDAVRLVDRVAQSDDVDHVTLAVGARRYVAEVTRRSITGQRPKSCGDAPSAIVACAVAIRAEREGEA